MKENVLSDFIIENGILLQYKGNDENVIIPETVECIGDDAFMDCTNLISVTIGNSVKHIGSMAFAYCSNLQNIHLSDSVTSIGFDAFEDTAWYNNQPDGVVYADKVLYKYKGTMPENTKIIVKDGTKTIACGAFMYCYNLSEISFPQSLTSIGESAFECCIYLKNIVLPACLTNIESEAFSGCCRLTHISFPDSLIYIGYDVFDNTTWYDNCPDGVTYAGQVLYKYKGAMPKDTHIIITDGTKGIANGAFSDCDSLQSIIIPDSVTNIGCGAFCNCRNLESVIIGRGVSAIGKGAFLCCSNLAKIVISNENNTYHSTNNCIIETKKKKLIFGCKTSAIPDDGSVAIINNNAFNGCRYLEKINIPESVKSIGEGAFEGCCNLSAITIPNKTTSIGNYAFIGCHNLTNILVAAGNSVYHSNGNCLIETKSKTLIAGCMTSIIPDDGSVTTISNNAFNNCNGLKSIVIPDAVRMIDKKAFYTCVNLTKVTIGNGLASIGYDAFYRCPIETAIIPTTACRGVSNILLKTVVITNGTSIPEYAFFDCDALTDISIPTSVMSIGEFAFGNCNNLTNVYYSGNVSLWKKIRFHNKYSNPLHYAKNLYINNALE